MTILVKKTGIVVLSLLSSLEHYLRIIGTTTIILTVIVKKNKSTGEHAHGSY